jgi:hypothetical protein
MLTLNNVRMQAQRPQTFTGSRLQLGNPTCSLDCFPHGRLRIVDRAAVCTCGPLYNWATCFVLWEELVTIIDLYSKRQKKLRGEYPDVYQYDELPKSLKVQVVQIWRSVIGIDYTPATQLYTAVVEILRREYGVFVLAESQHPLAKWNAEDELSSFSFSQTVGNALTSLSSCSD